MKIVRYALIALAIAPQALAQPTITFTPANPMTKARAFFTANELPDGNVLVAGGYDGSCQCAPNFADSEIYNRHTGIWTATTPMNSARAAAVSVRLENRVLVIGGYDENFNVLASAEIYNPRTAGWTLTAPMNDARVEDFTAVTLSDERDDGHRAGKVLVAGGTASDGVTSLSSAEIYNEATNSWTRTGSMNVGRGEYVSVQLLDGRVLAIGGVASDGTALSSTEIYNPATGVWTLTGSMSAGRNDAQAVRLRDGRVVVAGGGTGSEDNPRLKSAEIFDPATGQWTATGDMSTPRSEADHAAVLLRHDIMLVPGGLDAPHENVASTDLYNPRTGKWTAGAPMSEPRSGHVALTLKAASDVIVMGGLDQGPAATASVDIGTTP